MAHQHHQPFIYADSYDTNHQDLLSLQAGMEMLAMPSNKNFFTKDEAASWHDYQQQQLSLSLPQQVNNNHYFHHHHHLQQQQQQHPYEEETKFYMRSSIYLIPAQELLNEFCSLSGAHCPRKQKPSASASSSSPSVNQSHQPLLSMDMLELQKRKAKLLSMLEEVERRYKRYCEQMRAVVASFEAAAGEGSATVYSTLASKAMSRHFRCLRDGILGQIQATKKAMGEKDPVSPGTTKGETPRLKLLDQCIRQQKVYQQAGVMESSHPWRPQRGLPERSVSILRAWLFEHFLHPYPSDVDKHILARQTGLSRSQVSNWFINARVRLWKPMVEEMYLEETKEQDNQSSQGTAERETSDNNSWPNRNPNPSSSHQDQKPHLHIETGSLSSIINHSASPLSNARGPSHFGAVDLDFSSYNDHCSSSSSRSFRGGVSLTLGLQQHGGEAVDLSFSPASQMFFSREQMEECEPVQFSVLDGEEQNLPYRDLMGAQLLHDLAG